MSHKPSSAFVKTRKGFCYLTAKVDRSNHNIMRVRNYAPEPQDKRDTCWLYPDCLFDWKKIGRQPAEKREVCRAYRPKRQAPRSTERTPESFVMVSYDSRTCTVYTPDACDSMTLLDTVLHMERVRKEQFRQAAQPIPDIPRNRLRKMTATTLAIATWPYRATMTCCCWM